MFDLGFFEFIIFAMIALIVLGPEKLLHVARMLGKWYALICHAKDKLSHQMTMELQLLETQAQLKSELAKLRATESAIKAQINQLQKTVQQNRQPMLAHVSDNQSLDNQQSPMDDWTQEHITQDWTDNVAITKHAMATRHWFLLSNDDKHHRLASAPFVSNMAAGTRLT